MSSVKSSASRGFTLVELAIVLSVVAMMSAGLWRLMNSSNSTVQDQAAATQQQQLITAVKGYLNDQGSGNTIVTQLATGGSWILPLPNPATATAIKTACQVGYESLPAVTFPGTGITLATLELFCNYLPNGFNNATTNSYGQTFEIGLKKDDTTGSGTQATAFSFMVLTQGGGISDMDGARIASYIGNDGGFVYTAGVCNATTGKSIGQSACGAFLAWTADTYAYGLGTANSGDIASRTVSGSGAIQTGDWLWRDNVGGPPSSYNTSVPAFNTMTTNLNLVNQAELVAYDNIGNAIAVIGDDPGNVPGTIKGVAGQFTSNSASTAGSSYYSTGTYVQPADVGDVAMLITRRNSNAYGTDNNSDSGCSGQHVPSDSTCDALTINGGASISGRLSTHYMYVDGTVFNAQ